MADLRVVLTGGDPHEELQALLPGRALTRCCSVCGAAHGRLVCDDPGVHVSLARAGNLALIAICDAPVGVDLEEIRRTAFDGFGGVALGPGERARSLPERARAWTRKEAVLKAAGLGLTVDPRRVDVSRDRTTWPVVTTLLDLPVPAGLAAAVAVVGVEPPRLLLTDHRS